MLVKPLILASTLAFSLNGWTQQDSTDTRTTDDLKRMHLGIRSQVAGYTGLAAAGPMVASYNRRWSLALLYGFAPPLQGAQAFHSVNVRLAYRPLLDLEVGKVSISGLLTGTSVLDVSGTSFLVLPEHYPAHYHRQQAIHFLLGIGGIAEMDLGKNSGRIGFSAEAIALDTYLGYVIRDRGQLSLRDAFGLGLGLQYTFN